MTEEPDEGVTMLATGRGSLMHIARPGTAGVDIITKQQDGWWIPYCEPRDGKNSGRYWAGTYEAASIEEAEAVLPWDVHPKCLAAYKKEHQTDDDDD